MYVAKLPILGLVTLYSYILKLLFFSRFLHKLGARSVVGAKEDISKSSVLDRTNVDTDNNSKTMLQKEQDVEVPCTSTSTYSKKECAPREESPHNKYEDISGISVPPSSSSASAKTHPELELPSFVPDQAELDVGFFNEEISASAQLQTSRHSPSKSDSSDDENFTNPMVANYVEEVLPEQYNFQQRAKDKSYSSSEEDEQKKSNGL